MDDSIRARLRAVVEQFQQSANACHRADHTQRVIAIACKLGRSYPGIDADVLETAAWLHDIGHTQAHRQGLSHAEVSAELAAEILTEYPFSSAQITAVCRAIADHRFSSGRVPESQEGKLLQDADRLDALGAIGIARTFAAGDDRDLYCTDDPFVKRHAADDGLYTIDHFYSKLLTLSDTLHTHEARALAVRRTEFMRIFLKEFADELSEHCP